MEPSQHANANEARTPPNTSLDSPPITCDMRLDQAARTILIHYLERIQQLAQAPEIDIVAFRTAIQCARRVFRSMGEQFDVTGVASIPKQLRWLSKISRPLREWHMLIGHSHDHVAKADEGIAGVEAMLAHWSGQRNQAYQELESLFGGKRFREFGQAAQRLAQSEDAGIFGRRAARAKIDSILPDMVGDQYQQILDLEDKSHKPGRKSLRELRRQVRNLAQMLCHFQAVLGPTGAYCRSTTVELERHLTAIVDLDQAAETAKLYMKSANKKNLPVDGVVNLIQAISDERSDLIENLPEMWGTVTSPGFRQALSQAVAQM